MLKIIFLLLSAGLASADTPSTVTIPVEEFLKLRQIDTQTKFASVEHVKVSGVYGEAIKIRFDGFAIGVAQTLALLSFDPNQLQIKDCSGAKYFVDSNRQLSVYVPVGSFSLDCSVVPKQWREASLNFVKTVGVEVEVKGAEFNLSGIGEGAVVTLFEKQQPSEGTTNQKISTTARYNITLYPESTEFNFSFEVFNPSRVKRDFDLKFGPEVQIQSVSTSVKYQEKKNDISFSLLPGKNRIDIYGSLSEGKFKPLMKSEQAFLLISSHPSLQLKMNDVGRRIDVSQTGMSPGFAAARAYLLQDNEEMTWQSEKLEAFSTLGFTFNKVTHTYFVPSGGSAVAEAEMMVDNKGLPEIPLKIPGTPNYLAIDGEPQVLSKDKDGNLLIQVSSGQHQIFVQYLPEKSHSKIASLLFAKFPSVPAFASEVVAQVKFEESPFVPLALGMGSVFSDVIWEKILISLFVALIFVFVFLRMVSDRRGRILSSLAMTFLIFVFPNLIPVIVLCSLGLWIFRKRAWLMGLLERQSKFVKGMVATVVIASVGIFALIFTLRTMNSVENIVSRREAPAMDYAKAKKGMRADVTMSAPNTFNNSVDLLEEGASGGGEDSESFSAELKTVEPTVVSRQNQGQDYKGVPTLIKIPESKRTIYFSRKMVEANQGLRLCLAGFGDPIANILVLMALLFMGRVVYLNRGEFAKLLQN